MNSILKLKYYTHYLEKFLLLIVGVYLFAYQTSLLSNLETGYFLLKIGMGLNIYLIFKTRKIKPFAAFFLFTLTYQLNLIAYYRDGADISGGFTIFDRIDYYNYTEWHHVIFLWSVAFFMPLIIQAQYLKDKFKAIEDPVKYWITLIFMAIIVIFGYRGGNVFDVGGYGNLELESLGGTSIFEYFIVLVPIIFIYAGNNKFFKWMAYIVIGYFVLKGLSFGFRNNVLQLGLLFFAILDNPKVKYWQLVLIGIIPLYILLILGAIRVNPMILFSNEMSQILLYPINDFGLELLGNQNDIFYASVRIFALIEQGIISNSQRLLATFSNILSLGVPYSYLPDLANLAGYRQNDYGALGGCLISTYWYVFAGIPGIIFIGWYISFLIRKFITSTNQYFFLYVALVLTTYPRWFGYNQISLFKISLYGVLYYILLIFISRIIQMLKKSSLA